MNSFKSAFCERVNMKILRISMGLLCAVYLFSCAGNGVKNDEALLRDKIIASKKQYAEAYRAYRMDQYEIAQSRLKPLLNDPYVGRSAKLLKKTIEDKIEYQNLKAAQSLSDQSILTEVEKTTIKPETYGDFKIFDKDVGPFDLPVGPMEKLLKKKIDMDVTNANLEVIIEAISKYEGVNIIADQELQGERELTIKVKQVPIGEILQYVERNMGLTFQASNNIIWVTKAAEEAPEVTGPKLITKVIRLRKPYIPQMQGGAGAATGGGNRGEFNRGGGRGGRGGGGGGGGAGGGNEPGYDDLLMALVKFLPDSDGAEAAGEDVEPVDGDTPIFRMYRNRGVLVIRDSLENIRLAQEPAGADRIALPDHFSGQSQTTWDHHQ